MNTNQMTLQFAKDNIGKQFYTSFVGGETPVLRTIIRVISPDWIEIGDRGSTVLRWKLHADQITVHEVLASCKDGAQ